MRVATSTVVEISGRIARTTITETFENRGGRLGEADVLYPLPSGAAFEELRLEIDGRLVAGQVLDAAQARTTYERIVREQRDPALVEWAGLGLLRARIFPFGAGERRTVVVRHRQVLPLEGDALRITGQLVGVDDVRDERGTGTFRIRWRGDSLGTPWSPTHSVRVRDVRGGDDAIAATVRGGMVHEALLSGSTGHVVAYLPVRGDARAPGVTVLTYSEAAVRGPGGMMSRASVERHALVIVTPPREAPVAMPRDITLVLDVSGSMAGEKLAQAVAAGRALLATLRPTDRFQLLAFSDAVTTHAEQLVPATPASVRTANRWLDQLAAAGGTNIGDAMQVALATLASGERDDSRRTAATSRSARLPLLLLLTDGEPTVGLNPAAILDSTTAWRGDARVFSFGVGAGVDATLVEQLALRGRGSAHFVRPEESVERAVSLLAQRLAAPLLANVQVTLDGGQLQQLYAPLGTDLMTGQELVFLARYTGASTGRVRVRGTTGEQGGAGLREVRTDYRFGARDSANGFVPRLWAVQRVAALDAMRRRHGGDGDADRIAARTREFDDEMRALGDRYGIPTPLTSYLVLEPGATVAQDLQGTPVGSPPPTPAGARRVAVGNAKSVAGGPPSVQGGRPMIAADANFERARRAAEQRAAVNLSAADAVMRSDEAELAAGAQRRTVRGVVFERMDSTWTDRRLLDDRAWKPRVTVRVKPFSAAWTALVQALPELREPFALGDRLRVRGREALVEVAPDGADRLGADELSRLRAAW